MLSRRQSVSKNEVKGISERFDGVQKPGIEIYLMDRRSRGRQVTQTDLD